jgi:hypothetical protein
MRIEINILSQTEAHIYVNLGEAYRLHSSGFTWRLYDPNMNEIRRWRIKDGHTVKDAIPEGIRLVLKAEEASTAS